MLTLKQKCMVSKYLRDKYNVHSIAFRADGAVTANIYGMEGRFVVAWSNPLLRKLEKRKVAY